MRGALARPRQPGRDRPIPITPSFLRRWPLPLPDGARGKDGRGGVCIVGGCVEVPGAVLLASVAALRAGAGRLQIATVRDVAPAIGVALPEARVVGLRQRPDGELDPVGCRGVITKMAGHDAVLIGPGMGPESGSAARALVRGWRAQPGPPTVILDAGALLALTRERFHSGAGGGSVIVTPHAGEMARMWDVEAAEVRRRPLELAREVAAHLGVVVVMKGAITFIVGPTGRAFVNERGSPGLGTSGSGDVLAGIIAGLCARGASAEQAAVWAVHLHAQAGERLSRRIGRPDAIGFLARELSGEVPQVMARLARR